MLHVELMAQFEPGNVYPFLAVRTGSEGAQAYPLEECVAVCRERGITDAEAHLLERTGDARGALELILRTVESCLVALRNRLRTYLERDLVAKGVLDDPNQSAAAALASPPTCRA